MTLFQPPSRCIPVILILVFILNIEVQAHTFGRMPLKLPEPIVDSQSTANLKDQLIAADLNGDGLEDLIYISEGLRVRRNAGQFSITEPPYDESRQLLGSLGGFGRFCLGDVDGDGDLDILLSERNSSYNYDISWISNISEDGGDIIFQGKTAIIQNREEDVDEIYLVDLNTDSRLDIVCYSWSDSRYTYYLQSKYQPTFSTKGILLDESNYGEKGSIVFEDIDGDGDVDFVANHDSNVRYNSNSGIYFLDSVCWYENVTDASFHRDVSLVFSEHIIDTELVDGRSLQPHVFYVLDLDADGDKDILALDYWLDELIWYENRSGAFSDDYEVLATDVDCFYQTAYPIYSTWSVDSSDEVLNRSSILYLSDSGLLKELYFDDEEGAWLTQDIVRARRSVGSSGWAGATQILVSDVNANGLNDIIVSMKDNYFYMVKSEAVEVDLALTGEINTVATAYRSTKSIAFGDVDSDGDSDLFAYRADHYGEEGIRLFESHLLNAPDYSFSKTSETTYNVMNGPLFLYDVDGDSDLDILTLQYNGIVYFKNEYAETGDVIFSADPEIIYSGDFDTFSIGDVDLDGVKDIVALGTIDGGSVKLAILRKLPEGEESYFSSQVYPFSEIWSHSYYAESAVLGLEDLDLDGDLDVVAVTDSAMDVGYYWIPNLLIETGTFGLSTSFGQLSETLSRIYPFPVTGDFNTDGIMDLIVWNDALEIYSEAGEDEIEFREPVIFTPWWINEIQEMKSVDIDQDGDFDLICRSDSDGMGILFWLENQTDGESFVFSWPKCITSEIQGGGYFDLQDLDGDGDLDIYAFSEWARGGADSIIWLENRSVRNPRYIHWLKSYTEFVIHRDTEDAGPLALQSDFDGDGLANLLEYVLNTSPTAADDFSFAVSLGDVATRLKCAASLRLDPVLSIKGAFFSDLSSKEIEWVSISEDAVPASDGMFDFIFEDPSMKQHNRRFFQLYVEER